MTTLAFPPDFPTNIKVAQLLVHVSQSFLPRYQFDPPMLTHQQPTKRTQIQIIFQVSSVLGSVDIATGSRQISYIHQEFSTRDSQDTIQKMTR